MAAVAVTSRPKDRNHRNHSRPEPAKERIRSDAARLYTVDLLGVPQIARQLDVGETTVREALLLEGVQFRTWLETRAINRAKGLEKSTKGSTRGPFSEEHKRRMRTARRRHFVLKGNRWRVNSDGYLVMTRGKKKECLQHVLYMEQHIGRKLRKGEHVHHIDEDKLNNRISNLLLVTNREHKLIHWKLDRARGIHCRKKNETVLRNDHFAVEFRDDRSTRPEQTEGDQLTA